LGLLLNLFSGDLNFETSRMGRLTSPEFGSPGRRSRLAQSDDFLLTDANYVFLICLAASLLFKSIFFIFSTRYMDLLFMVAFLFPICRNAQSQENRPEYVLSPNMRKNSFLQKRHWAGRV